MKTDSIARKYLLITVIIVSVTLLSVQVIERSFEGAGAETILRSSPEQADVHRITVQDSIDTLDPVLMSNTAERLAGKILYDSLFYFHPETGELLSRLVEDVSREGSSYYLTISAGQTFHTGRKVTAEDVKFTLERFVRVSDSYNLGYETLLDDVEGFREFLDREEEQTDVAEEEQEEGIGGLEVIDTRTLAIHLEEPDDYFLEKLAVPQLGVLEKQVVESVERYGFSLAPREELSISGTGSGRIVEWSFNVLAFENHPDVSSDFPQRVEMIVTGDKEQALDDLETYRVDGVLFGSDPVELLREVNPELINYTGKYAADSVYALHFGRELEESFIYALLYALNRDHIAGMAGARPLKGQVPPSISSEEADEEEARGAAHLSAAVGREVTLYLPEEEPFLTIAGEIQKQWEMWGVAVEIEYTGSRFEITQPGHIRENGIMLLCYQVGDNLPEQGLFRFADPEENSEDPEEQANVLPERSRIKGILHDSYWFLSFTEKNELYLYSLFREMLQEQGLDAKFNN